MVGSSHLGEDRQIAECPESELEPGVLIRLNVVVVIHGGVLHRVKSYISIKFTGNPADFGLIPASV